MSDENAKGLLEAEALIALQGAATPANALINKLEEATNALRAAHCSTEKQRQLGNLVEWARMVRMRVERLAEQIAGGA